MNKSKALLGLPSNFQNLFNIYPPLVKDVVGNDNYHKYVALLTMTQEELEDELVEKDVPFIPTPLQYLFLNVGNSEEFLQIAKDAFEFFIHRKVTFLIDQQIILIGDLQEELQRINNLNDLHILNEANYFDFQNDVRQSLGMDIVEKPDPNMPAKLKAMKAKARLRDKIKAKQQQKDGADFSDYLTSICCMGIGITPLNIGELSYASIKELVQRYQYKEKYDIDISSLLAGADSKKVKPKYWMNQIK